MQYTVKGNAITQHVASTNANPEWLELPRTGGTPVTDTHSFTESELVDTTDQGVEQVLTEVSVEGSNESETLLANEGNHLMWASLLRNAATTTTVSATVSFASGVMTDDGASGAFADLTVGSYIVPKGATLNGGAAFRVSVKTDDNTVTLVPSPQDEAAQTVSFSVVEIRNSNQRQEMSYQERVPTQSGTLYNTFQNAIVTAGTFTTATSALHTSTMSIMGFERLDQDTQVTGSTDGATTSSSPMGSVNGVIGYIIDDVLVDRSTRCFTDFTCEIDTGATAEYAQSGKGACVISQSRIAVTGTLNSFSDGTDVATYQSEKDKMRNETKFSLAGVFKDPQDNYMIISMPYVKYTDLTQAELANGTTKKDTGTYAADGQGALGYTVQITVIS